MTRAIKKDTRVMIKSVQAFDTEMGVKVGMTGKVLSRHYYQCNGYYVEFDNGQVQRMLDEQLIVVGLSKDTSGYRVVSVKNKAVPTVTVFMFNLSRTGRAAYHKYTGKNAILNAFNGYQF